MAITDPKPFDPAAYAVEEVNLPPRKGGRPRTYENNPYTGAVKASYDTETGRQVTVPAVNAKDVVALIRRAATDGGIGVRVVVLNMRGETLDLDAQKRVAKGKSNVRVQFQGKVRKQRKPAAPTAEIAPPVENPPENNDENTDENSEGESA